MTKWLKNYSVYKDTIICQFVIFIWFFIFIASLAVGRSFPYIYDDEYGVLGAAAVFAGYDWQAPAMPFYGFMLSLLVLPFYLIGSDVTTTYHSALILNGLLLAISACLTFSTVRMLAPGTPILIALLAVVAGFSYPAAVHYSLLALGETSLLFCLSLAILALTKITFKENNTQAWVFVFGLALALSPFAHSRGYVFILAALLPVVVLIYRRSLSFRDMLIMAVAFLAIFSVFSLLKGYLLENFYTTAKEGTASVSSFIIIKLSSIDIEILRKIFLVAYGQLTYLVSSSFGLLLVFFGTVLSIIKANKETDIRQKNNKLVVIGFIVICFLGMFAASVLQMSGASRVDHYFYGRYNEILMPVIISISLITLATEQNLIKLSRVKILFLVMLCTLIMLWLLKFYPEDALSLGIQWFSLIGWFVYIQSEWAIVPHDILIGFISASVVLIMALLLSRYLYLSIITLFFVIAGIHNFQGQHLGADRGWSEYAKASQLLKPELKGIPITLAGINYYNQIRSEALQLAFPKSMVNMTETVPSNAKVIFRSKEKCEEQALAYSINSDFLCVVNENLKKKLQVKINDVKETVESGVIIEALKFEQKPDRVPISAGSIGSRICAVGAKYFYTRFMRFCLPKIKVRVAYSGVKDLNKKRIGFVIADEHGNWLSEWREAVPEKKKGDYVWITTAVKYPFRIDKGDYQITAAPVGSQGWQWNAKDSIPLKIK